MKEAIVKMYLETEMTQRQIAAHFGIGWKVVWRILNTTLSRDVRKRKHIRNLSISKLAENNPMYGKRAEEHHNYVGIVSDNKGYWMVLKPEWYTGRKGSKHVFLHSVVVCGHLGLTEVPKGQCVHHCDFNPSNNDFDNLVMLGVGEHRTLHKALAGVTTISKESTLKWVEARRAGNSYDIVCSA